MLQYNNRYAVKNNSNIRKNEFLFIFPFVIALPLKIKWQSPPNFDYLVDMVFGTLPIQIATEPHY